MNLGPHPWVTLLAATLVAAPIGFGCAMLGGLWGQAAALASGVALGLIAHRIVVWVERRH